jgi:hypothetical protein
MVEPSLFKRILLRAKLREVSPMVIRLISVSDQLALPEFHQIFCSLLGWSGNLVVSGNSNRLCLLPRLARKFEPMIRAVIEVQGEV